MTSELKRKGLAQPEGGGVKRERKKERKKERKRTEEVKKRERKRLAQLVAKLKESSGLSSSIVALNQEGSARLTSIQVKSMFHFYECA